MSELKPMVALNVYLTPEFRRQILSEVLTQKDSLNPETKTKLFPILKDKLKVSGFRSYINAPKSLTIRALESLFEKDSYLISAVLSSWSDLIQSKPINLSKFLSSLGFIVRPNGAPDYDPENSFLVGWPSGVSYESLYQKAKEQFESLQLSSDELALITIWRTGTLPGEFESENN